MTDHAQRRPVAVHQTVSEPAGGVQEADASPTARRRGRGGIIAVRVVAIALGLVLPLLVLEVAIRLFGPFLPGNYDTGSMIRRHPILGHFHPAGTHTWVKTPQFTIRMDFNPMGLRDPRQTYAKPAGTFRVLALGDSYVEGAQVQADQTMAAQLEAMLTQAAGRPVEVINGGVFGYGTTQEYLLLDEEGVKYQPDLVLLFFCHCNDIANNNYRLELKNSDLKLALKPYFDLREDDDELRLIPPPQPSSRTSIRERLRDYSLLYHVIETGVVYKLELQNPLEPFNGVGGLEDPTRGKYDAKPTGEWARSWRITDAVIEKVRDRAAQAGAPVAIVQIPEWRKMDREYWDKDDTKRLVASKRGGPEAPIALMNGIAARLGVPTLDLYQTFRPKVEADGMFRYHVEGDYHWSVDGNLLAAQTVAAFLTERGLVPR